MGLCHPDLPWTWSAVTSSYLENHQNNNSEGFIGIISLILCFSAVGDGWSVLVPATFLLQAARNREMIEHIFPNSRALLPIFCTNCPDGPHFAQMGSHFTQSTTPNPCLLLSRHTPLSGICTYTKHPQAHPKTPLFLA